MKIFKFLFHRVVLAGVCILFQILSFAAVIVFFRDYFVEFYAGCLVLSLITVIWIVNNHHQNPAYKIAWIIPILLLPLFGGPFYLILGGNRLGAHARSRLSKVADTMKLLLPPSREMDDALKALSLDAANQSRYITQYAFCPPYGNTESVYLPLGEVQFQRMLEELDKAKHFIFMEYFIICPGKMWDTILSLLVKKAREGVDVRLMYDDFGCIVLLPGDYPKQLQKLGIRCQKFNPLRPFLDVRMNNRDHRKICVIDGHTGFTGGSNLSDEYINVTHPYGHWKDTAVMLRGDAVWSLTVMFLTMWENATGSPEDYAPYRPSVYGEECAPVQPDGFVQPFTDCPLDDESIGETVYLNLINKAERYVYITTPYLIINNEMITALCSAAKAGVDVRIITPHIPDKKMVFNLTRSHYRFLIEAGVRIFEYTPGFIHAKSFVADDTTAVVGTINMDYRSLFLHFECAAWMYRTQSVLQLRDDYLETLKVCQEITLETCRSVSLPRRIYWSVLRIFAPLL